MESFTLPPFGLSSSLHNHSDWSDGASSIRDMCLAGKRAGLRLFGLSDHYVLLPYPDLSPVEWSIDLSKLDDYVETLLALRAELEDETFRLAIGLEVDFFYETFEEVRDILKPYPLDYVIGSVHYAGRFPIDHSASYWEGLSQREIDGIHRCYWHSLLGAAESGFFSFLGHLDLPKKFGYRSSEADLPFATKVLEAAAKTGTGIEINTAGWEKTCAEQYPSRDIIDKARELGVPIVINSDAHHSDHVTRHFGRAVQL